MASALIVAVGSQAVVFGREARGFTLTSTGAAVILADGSAVHGDIVVGADGVGSVIRAGLHPDERPPQASGYHALRGVSYDAGHLLGDADAGVYLGDGVECGFARAG